MEEERRALKLIGEASEAFVRVSDMLMENGSVTPQFGLALEKGRALALRAQEMGEREEREGPGGSDSLRTVLYLYRRVFNDTWKLFMGDAVVHLGAGIDTDRDFREAIVQFFKNLGKFLRSFVDTAQTLGSSGLFDQEAISAYGLAVKSHMRLAAVCGSYVSKANA